jgi:energy-coupling factor transporter ATP-binding protein EcfA2
MDIGWGSIIGVAKVGAEYALDEQKRKSLIDKLLLLIRQKKIIILFGNSGSGKSQFINSIRKVVEIPDRTLATYSINKNIESFPLKIIDTPGHAESSLFRKEEVSKIINGSIEGVINVVSYGYDESPDASRNIAYDLNENIKQEYLQNNRVMEIARLSEWVSWITPSNIKWIINLVNKADLWWDDYQNVENYYKNSEYSEKFNSIKNYVHVINVPYCSIIRPFFGVRTSGHFGEEEKYALYNNLWLTLFNLINGVE